MSYQPLYYQSKFQNTTFLLVEIPLSLPNSLGTRHIGSLRSSPYSLRTSKIEKSALFLRIHTLVENKYGGKFTPWDIFFCLSSFIPKGDNQNGSQKIWDFIGNFQKLCKMKKNVDFYCTKVTNLKMCHSSKFPKDPKE